MPKILALISNPDNDYKLRADKEVKAINKMISDKANTDFTCTLFQAITIKELPSLLEKNQPDILHFSGHGTENGLIFEDDQGNGVSVNVAALKPILEECCSTLVCLFLSACNSKPLAEKISEIIPYVITFPEKIEDQKATEFSELFYAMLVMGKSFEASFKVAKSVLMVHLADETSRLPTISINKKLPNFRETIYNPPVLTVEFQDKNCNKKGYKEKKNCVFLADIKNLPEGATQIIYEYLDITVTEEERFECVENLKSGTAVEFSCYGNIVIRAWIWVDNKKSGLAIETPLVIGLHNFYGTTIPKQFETAYQYIKEH